MPEFRDYFFSDCKAVLCVSCNDNTGQCREQVAGDCGCDPNIGCRDVGQAEFAPHLARHSPIDWQDFQDIFYWASELTNPYTGQPLQMVSHKNPSAGDGTFAPEDLPDPFADDYRKNLPPRQQILAFAQGYLWPSAIRMYCYNDLLEPVAHWKEDLRVTLLSEALYREDNPGA